jgi:hypothetical protein
MANLMSGELPLGARIQNYIKRAQKKHLMQRIVLGVAMRAARSSVGGANGARPL